MHCAAVGSLDPQLTFLGQFSNSTVSSYVEISADYDGQQRDIFSQTCPFLSISTGITLAEVTYALLEPSVLDGLRSAATRLILFFLLLYPGIVNLQHYISFKCTT